MYFLNKVDIPNLEELAAAVVGGYYFKVIIPKKKLELADDLEDFDFEDEDSEEV